MSDISKIKVPNGTVYDLKDETARSALAGKAAASHSHTISQISDFPASLPANGGNADTVDGKHANDFIYAHGYFDNIDLDDIKYPCSGLATNCAHSPSGQWGTLLVYAGGTGSFTQIYIPTANDNTPTAMYFRHFGGTGWTTWRNTADGGNATGIISDLSNNVSVTMPLSFTPAAVLFFNNYNHLVNSGFSLVIGTNQFVITPSSVSAMSTTTVRFLAFRG